LSGLRENRLLWTMNIRYSINVPKVKIFPGAALRPPTISARFRDRNITDRFGTLFMIAFAARKIFRGAARK